MHTFRMGAIAAAIRLAEESVVVGDPYWANVVALLRFEGADASTTFTDETGHAWTATNADISTDQRRFGGTSGDFRTNGAYLNSASGISGGMSGDFTIEGWFYPTVGTGLCAIARWGASGGQRAIYMNAGTLRWYNGTTYSAASAAITLNMWHHFAVTRQGSTIRVFVDGVLSGTTATDSQDLAGAFSICGDIFSQELGGYADEYRITKGVARYTSTFTPPTKRFPTNVDPSVVSAARWRIYITANEGHTNTSVTEVLFRSTDGTELVALGGTATASTTFSGSFPASQAFDRSTSTRWATAAGSATPSWLEFDFGTPVTPASVDLIAPSVDSNDMAKDFDIQYYDGSQWITLAGHMAQINWTSLERRNFAIQTVPADDALAAYTVALLRFNDIDGSTTFTDDKGKTWTLTGAGAIDTAQSKYGGASFEIPSTADIRLDCAHTDFNFGTGDYTIETWFRPSATSNRAVFSFGTRLVYVASSTWAYFNGSNVITGGSVAVGSWYHIALTRTSGVVRLFINGTQVGSSYSEAGAVDPGTMRIGYYSAGNPGGSHYDDFRVTKGKSRYSTNFTAPAQELTP